MQPESAYSSDIQRKHIEVRDLWKLQDISWTPIDLPARDGGILDNFIQKFDGEVIDTCLHNAVRCCSSPVHRSECFFERKYGGIWLTKFDYMGLYVGDVDTEGGFEEYRPTAVQVI